MPNTVTFAVGDRVKLKAIQESAYRPASLLAYLAANGLTESSAVFTVKDIFNDDQGTKVDFDELDTRGGYYLRRFERAPDRQDAGVTDAHRADIAAIAAALHREAAERGWCSAFDTKVELLNRSLTVPLPGRELAFLIGFVGLGTFTVKGTSEDDARDKATAAAKAAIQALA